MSGALASLLAEGGDALERARWAEAREAFAAALEIGVVGEALLGLSDARWWLGELDESVACKERAWLAQASRLVEDHRLDELRGWLLFATSFDCEEPVRAELLAREAYALARAERRQGPRAVCAQSDRGGAGGPGAGRGGRSLPR